MNVEIQFNLFILSQYRRLGMRCLVPRIKMDVMEVLVAAQPQRVVAINVLMG
jgi:hypothetical protein